MRPGTFSCQAPARVFLGAWDYGIKFRHIMGDTPTDWCQVNYSVLITRRLRLQYSPMPFFVTCCKTSAIQEWASPPPKTRACSGLTANGSPALIPFQARTLRGRDYLPGTVTWPNSKLHLNRSQERRRRHGRTDPPVQRQPLRPGVRYLVAIAAVRLPSPILLALAPSQIPAEPIQTCRHRVDPASFTRSRSTIAATRMVDA
jgi:hypothetical protein